MNIMAFILTTMAGLSTLLGGIVVFYLKKDKDKVIAFLLSFAAGVMISVSYFDLIPESLNSLINLNSNRWIVFLIFLVIGFLIALLIKKWVNRFTSRNNFYQLGIISMIVIILHNIPEGIITYITSDINLKLGMSMTLAIALHNIPEGVAIALPIYYGSKSKFKALLYTLIASLSEPFGAIITYLFLGKLINLAIIGCVYSLVAGMMIEIAIFELLSESLNKSYKVTFSGSLCGIFIFLLSHIL